MSADAAITLGIVIERRESRNIWQDHTWHVLAVLPDIGEEARWRELRRGDGWTQFLAGPLPLELYKGETEGYRTNLSQPTPAVFVVLRPGEEADEQAVEPFHLTVCPHEAMNYIESGDEIVEGVPMPAEIAAWVGAFVAAHHVDKPFKKRRNKRFAPEDGGAGRPRAQRVRGR